MRMTLFLPVILLVTLDSATTQAAPDLSAVADRYLAAERARQAEGATPTAVEAALGFLADTVVYEHPRVGARIEGKEPLRKGMLAFLGAVRGPTDKVLSRIEGPGVVVLDLEQTFETQQDGQWKAQSRRVTKVLEFDGDKIRRVIDYW